MVRLFIKPLLEERFALEINSDESVFSVKNRIIEQLKQMNRYVPQTCDLVFRGIILEDGLKMNSFKENDHCILLYKLDKTLPEINTSSTVVQSKPVEPIEADFTNEIELTEPQQISGEEDLEEDEDEDFNGTGEEAASIMGALQNIQYDGEESTLESLVALLHTIQPDTEAVNPAPNGPVQTNQNPVELPPGTLPSQPVTSADNSNVNNQPGQEQQVAATPPDPTFRINFSQLLRIIPFPENQDLQTLMGLGFPEWRCRKALLLNFFDADMAVEWLLNHSNDPNADDPFSEEEAASIIGALHNIRYDGEEPPPPNNIVEKIAQCIKNNKCTYTVTQKEFAPQKWYYCYSCGLVDSEGVCESCAVVCHKNHKLSAVRSSKKFYCDCGAGAYDCKCNTPEPQ